MPIKLLQTIKISGTAEEYEDIRGSDGIVIQLRQLPEDIVPSITVRLTDGNVIDDLMLEDLELIDD